ncbi:MAG: phosphate ABC transporter permease PstA, partial [Rhodospirillales bacterium]|nr:phosphate ABC transporter permease PstA [Rhodospirillales bacterium]
MEKRRRMSALRGKRHRAEIRFRRIGIAAVSVGLVFLTVLFLVVLTSGLSAFKQTVVQLDVAVEPTGDDYQAMVKRSLRESFPEVKARKHRRELYNLISSDAAYRLKAMVQAEPGLAGQTVSLWVVASDDVDMVVKGRISRTLPPDQRRFTDRQLVWVDVLEAAGRLKTQFNWAFFTSGDSREPELAGIAVATLGSLFSLLVCLALSFPLGVLTAVYLEEFAPRTRWTDFIEVNINNLAAVPSIVFGLLGLAVFLNVFELPRSAPLVGGMVLALMTLPTIIITGRAALKAVPPSIREAALAVGASPLQAVFHHVLPLAMPGVLTGTIIGTARALGET